ncbi:MAG TPA: hypothetical protein VED59_04715 [Acidimicrobiales bacterium]|nr:hypothetical protein [Acidimicrobiales bacterium]
MPVVHLEYALSEVEYWPLKAHVTSRELAARWHQLPPVDPAGFRAGHRRRSEHQPVVREQPAAAAARYPQGVLDTSTFILLGQLPNAHARPKDPLITGITLAELSAGPLHATTAHVRARRQAHLQEAEADFDPLPFDVEAYPSPSQRLTDNGNSHADGWAPAPANRRRSSILLHPTSQYGFFTLSGRWRAHTPRLHGWRYRMVPAVGEKRRSANPSATTHVNGCAPGL